ncbi:peptidase U32 family protein [Williamwhitmania taraxaci]|uniref:Putative protease n=1 Tax=Williamwhitmania taraxaci TaxID=1640674 RepID=A0A1G6RD29_9BACT|nr:U32 family peptidase [Williamwhitmania taraxaci]SDD01796.1 putative protease [Williamwhitmania taraxaci]
MAIIPLELLAPAKDYQTGVAAINCGADAVYIGGPKFGARAAVGNSIADIEKLATYAHRYSSKVYLVINTLLYENEVAQAVALAHQAWNSGIDALIIQDFGLLETALPPIPLFASTQTNNTTPEKGKFLENAGFSRVILARELNLKQIAEIRQATSVPLESFVHGALCVSYSGQCYLSQALTGRSANRGACAQPCRMAYNLIDDKGNRIEKNQHLLSLRDLNLTNHIEELAKAGISSFKIEGRLKDEGYVKNTVRHYRSVIDKIIENNESFAKASSGNPTTNFTPDLERSFSRGFTNYFLDSRKEMASRFTPKSVGKRIGLVTGIEASSFKINTTERLSNGDGICFFVNQQLLGTNINQVEGNRIFPNSMEGITKGIEVFRNFDKAFNDSLSREVSRKVNATITLGMESGLTITAIDEDGIAASITIGEETTPSTNPEKATQTWIDQLSKGGDSMFNISGVSIEPTPAPFLPVGRINALRRELLNALEEQRVKNYYRETKQHIPTQHPYPEKELMFSGNVVNSYARRFFERHGSKVLQDGYELIPSNAGDTVMTTKYCLRYELGDCLKDRAPKEIQLPAKLFLENNGKRLALEFDCPRCEMKIKLT